jgi:hypothetical protein
MQKHIDLKNRVVDFYDIDTRDCEDEIVGYLDRKMKVRFHSAMFNNSQYVFIRGPGDQSQNSITVSSYRRKKAGENISVSFQ